MKSFSVSQYSFAILILIGDSGIRARMDSLALCKHNLESAILSLVEPFRPQIDLVLTVPGIQLFSAISIISEIGVDTSVFPTAKHLCSWAGLVPQNNEILSVWAARNSVTIQCNPAIGIVASLPLDIFFDNLRYNWPDGTSGAKRGAGESRAFPLGVGDVNVERRGSPTGQQNRGARHPRKGNQSCSSVCFDPPVS
jgi:hypothetical protein